MSDYSVQHWSKRIPEYLAADWSDKPTPFAVLSSAYFPAQAKILELGAGGGMDSLWFASQGFHVVMTDGSDVGFYTILERARKRQINISAQILDMNQLFDFPDGTFDVVYSQLSIHYFSDKIMRQIMAEIYRVLRPGGVFACMVNSTKDVEYDASKTDSDGLIRVGQLTKRYFTPETFQPFVTAFETVLLNDKGKTPKDDAVSNSGMIQFVGIKV